MIKLRTACFAALLLLGGCVTGYTLVTPGVAAVGDMRVSAATGYNLVPSMSLAGQRKGAQTWTQDGLLLDRVTLIPGVPDGEALLVTRDKSAALPVFRKDMLPNEIEELVESTLVKYIGEGNAAVSTENLRPHRFGDERGVLFDVSAVVAESPEYRGLVGAFVADEKLYVMWYLAAEPYYYGKHLPTAEAVIRSARLGSPPAGTGS